MFSVLLAAYGLVLVAELPGDKTLYTLATLATRCRTLPLLCGSSAAFALKILAAVLLGDAISNLRRQAPGLVAGLTAATFLVTAIALWIRKPETAPAREKEGSGWATGMAAGFAAIFLTEWGDPGQIATAALAAQFHAPALVWLGGTLALITKGALSITLGLGLRRWLPVHLLRYGGVALCLFMAVVSAFRIEL
jgi:putative Ca2+/H+ antiporter (TMEM165/GDT1 family)